MSSVSTTRSRRSHQSQFSHSMSATTISLPSSITELAVDTAPSGGRPRRRNRRTRSVVKRLSRSGRSGPIMSRSSLLRPRSDSSHHQSASCSNLEQLEGRRYSVTYFKHKVVDSDSVNRCGDHNVNVVNVERNATKTQLQLYNVLKSFSLYQRAIGYTSNSGLRFALSVPFLFGSDFVHRCNRGAGSDP